MNQKERRKFPRVASDNFHMNIALKKADTQCVPQIECRVVNFSLTGLQIETKYPIESEHVHLLPINLEKNPIEIRGRVVYCEKFSAEMFHVGISLIGSNMDKYKFISQITRPFGNSQVKIAIDGTQHFPQL